MKLKQGVGGTDGLTYPSIAISPDGRHLYSTSFEGKVGVFSRNSSTGVLSFSSVVENGAGGVFGIGLPFAAVVNNSGTAVYVISPDDAEFVVDVASFARDSASGALTFLGAVGTGGLGLPSQDYFLPRRGAVSPDDAHVYVGSKANSSVYVFRPLTVMCTPEPKLGCKQPTIPGKCSVQVKDNAVDKKDRVMWRWTKGAATTLGDFGDPVGTLNDFVLCGYDQSGAPQPVLKATAPALDVCGSKPCWKATATGFSYTDGKKTPQGVAKTVLGTGAAGVAKISVSASGVDLLTPTLPFMLPLTIQLQAAGGECWGATYSTPTVNDASVLKAKSD